MTGKQIDGTTMECKTISCGYEWDILQDNGKNIPVTELISYEKYYANCPHCGNLKQDLTDYSNDLQVCESTACGQRFWIR
tara:strand:- start:71 stop:310 length:240 start_codon:yes stop_codon:yes gene_type:complete